MERRRWRVRLCAGANGQRNTSAHSVVRLSVASTVTEKLRRASCGATNVLDGGSRLTTPLRHIARGAATMAREEYRCDDCGAETADGEMEMCICGMKLCARCAAEHAREEAEYVASREKGSGGD